MDGVSREVLSGVAITDESERRISIRANIDFSAILKACYSYIRPSRSIRRHGALNQTI
jgi:hypothetical protein